MDYLLIVIALGETYDSTTLRHYRLCVSLKGNQGTLHEEVKTYFNDHSLLEGCLRSEENDKGHGRLEQRIAYSTDHIDWLQNHHQWPGLKSIGMVTSRVEKKGKISEEKRFYITSTSANAKLYQFPYIINHI